MQRHIRAKVTPRSLDRGIESRLGIYRVRIVSASRNEADLELKLSSNLETFTNIRRAIYIPRTCALPSASVLSSSRVTFPSIISIIRFAHPRHSARRETTGALSVRYRRNFRRDTERWKRRKEERSFESGNVIVQFGLEPGRSREAARAAGVPWGATYHDISYYITYDRSAMKTKCI